MKLQHIFFIFICSFFSCFVRSEDSQPSIVIPPGNPVHFTTNNYLQSEQGQSLKSDQKSDQKNGDQVQTNSQLASATATNLNSIHLWVDLWERQQKSLLEQSNSFVGLIDDNKVIISCMSLFAGYGCIAYKIYVANQIINHPSAWSNWKQEKTLEDLFTIPQSKLEADLLYAFQSRYIDSENPTDFIFSLVRSSISLQNEIDTVRKQIIRYKWIAACRAYKLLFLSEDSLHILQEKYRKLTFMKHI